jgi:hypothetical protein
MQDVKDLCNKAINGPSFVQYYLTNRFIYEEINDLLRSTSSPTKLEHIRWPVNQLYHYIQKEYNNAKITHPSCFSSLMFTVEELSRM